MDTFPLFSMTDAPIRSQERKADLHALEAGGYVEFEGRVRNHSQGRGVKRLYYEAYQELAQSEGEAIVQDALEQFPIVDAACVHRVGAIGLGEVAVWIGVVSAHRKDAFRACSYCIDEIKARLPIWKKETYADGTSEWVNCGCGHESSDPYAEAAEHQTTSRASAT
ncbi:MAG: molybdenum cofactor biosynthesis protein MoaE [Salinibacter sp.]